MKIYTKTGDRGDTGLFGGVRVSKASERVAVYGDVDELNSALGVARAHGHDPPLDTLLQTIQAELFQVGAELATVPGKEDRLGIPFVGDAEIAVLERAIDAAESELEPLKTFVLPGGSPAAAALHLARCVCRRAERAAVGLGANEPVRGEVVIYLNRLSDLLFVLARLANHRAKVPDVPWVGRAAKDTPKNE
jgi:cob(I)alamin adenosyltransferase